MLADLRRQVVTFVVFALTGHAPARRPPPPARTPLASGVLRAWAGSLALMFVTPPAVFALWMTATYYDGSLARFAREVDAATFLARLPSPSLGALGILGLWVGVQLALLLALPGETYLGPVTPAGNRPRYRRNGVAAWFVTHVGYYVASVELGLFSPAVVYDRLGELLATLNVVALAFCAFLYWKGRRYPSSTDAVHTGSLAYDFFQGVELHPTLLGVSLKQLVNCRVSMMGWSVSVLSFAAKQVADRGALSASMAVCAGLIALYLFKFFSWEDGYFGTLDIMHDRFGYYICWGVLVWVPSLYTVPALYLVKHPRALSLPVALAIALAGALAIWANYAADAQRQRVRATGGRTTVWGRAPELIVGRYTTADGEAREALLLASGYWGLARHFHYVPELALALCWTLPAGFVHALPYAYVAFLAALLVDRAGRDDRRCHAKYGAAWEEYRRRVPWRIVPWVY